MLKSVRLERWTPAFFLAPAFILLLVFRYIPKPSCSCAARERPASPVRPSPWPAGFEQGGNLVPNDRPTTMIGVTSGFGRLTFDPDTGSVEVEGLGSLC